MKIKSNFIRRPMDFIESMRSDGNSHLRQSGWSHRSKKKIRAARKAERQTKKIQRNVS